MVGMVLLRQPATLAHEDVHGDAVCRMTADRRGPGSCSPDKLLPVLPTKLQLRWILCFCVCALILLLSDGLCLPLSIKLQRTIQAKSRAGVVSRFFAGWLRTRGRTVVLGLPEFPLENTEWEFRLDHGALHSQKTYSALARESHKVRFLFSRSPKKDNPIESDEEANRARIQLAIDRAIQIPEVEIPERHEVKQFPAREDVNENAA
jgi:hypothetical protein